jgi:hypothetical protein
MWRVARRTTSERREKATRMKKGVRASSRLDSWLVGLGVGLDVSKIDYACDVALVADFESRATLDAYANHPEHFRIRAALSGMREARNYVDYYASEARCVDFHAGAAACLHGIGARTSLRGFRKDGRLVEVDIQREANEGRSVDTACLS